MNVYQLTTEASSPAPRPQERQILRLRAGESSFPWVFLSLRAIARTHAGKAEVSGADTPTSEPMPPEDIRVGPVLERDREHDGAVAADHVGAAVVFAVA
jgi:hypothetical protein